MWISGLLPLLVQAPTPTDMSAPALGEFLYCCPRCLRLLPDECKCARDLARRQELADLILLGVL